MAPCRPVPAGARLPTPARDGRWRSAPYPRPVHPRLISRSPWRKVPRCRSPRPHLHRAWPFRPRMHRRACWLCAQQAPPSVQARRTAGPEQSFAQTHSRLTPWVFSRSSSRSLAADGGYVFQVRGGLAVVLLHLFHCSGARRKALEIIRYGIALCKSSGTPGYSAGDSVKRSHTDAHEPSRRPSNSAATSAPSFSGSNLSSALERDLNALHRPPFQLELTGSGSLSQSNRSFAVSSENSLSKSSASRCLPLSPFHRGCRQFRQGAQHRLPRSSITRYVQTKASFFSNQEGLDGPVLAVLLSPADPAVLKFHQRLEAVRALLDRPELLPADTRQVDDRGLFFGDFRDRPAHRPRHTAARSPDPFGSPGA